MEGAKGRRVHVHPKVPKAKAAAYHEVDGGELYWWDGEWGDNWEPKK